ncbi:hypothetical protein thalar_01666 [Litoreibacter arenae DSM 19593]|uniref:Uncharacterized protein n=1 Tax=Litoreibacter arenae DSM 19593 TaxID=1123360 RepID=S9QFW4_9RHOB|nr:hypothetical protein thalar_01666 [Litoreibacter arenae DSM 19593]
MQGGKGRSVLRKTGNDPPPTGGRRLLFRATRPAPHYRDTNPAKIRLSPSSPV